MGRELAATLPTHTVYSLLSIPVERKVREGPRRTLRGRSRCRRRTPPTDSCVPPSRRRRRPGRPLRRSARRGRRGELERRRRRGGRRRRRAGDHVPAAVAALVAGPADRHPRRRLEARCFTAAPHRRIHAVHIRTHGNHHKYNQYTAKRLAGTSVSE